MHIIIIHSYSSDFCITTTIIWVGNWYFWLDLLGYKEIGFLFEVVKYSKAGWKWYQFLKHLLLGVLRAVIYLSSIPYFVENLVLICHKWIPMEINYQRWFIFISSETQVACQNLLFSDTLGLTTVFLRSAPFLRIRRNSLKPFPSWPNSTKLDCVSSNHFGICGWLFPRLC